MIGIQKISAYPCTLSLDLAELAIARGQDPASLDELMVKTRSLNPLFEDPVTMAVNAALSVLTDEDRERIELLVVGTESSPDFGKPIAAYVHRYGGIQPNCRTLETKHACYSGTSALMLAAHWVASGIRPGAKALVVTTDQSRAHFGKPWEMVMGAGAVAMIVGDRPDVLELELSHCGYWTSEVADTYRPTATSEVGHADDSLFCYLDGLEGAYDHFLTRAGDNDLDDYFQRHIYHMPFGGMAWRAHRALLRRARRVDAAEARAHFERKVRPSLTYNALLGGTYSSSTFFGLLGLIDSDPELSPGDRVSIFSYGSGSCAEIYEGRIGARAKEIVAAARLEELLEERRPVSVSEYERIERTRTERAEQPDYLVARGEHGDLYERLYAGRGRLVLEGVSGFERQYGLS
ncbi:MAG: hydroxymethylglutaryl-CoA synthase [Planctomycetota bacterium]